MMTFQMTSVERCVTWLQIILPLTPATPADPTTIVTLGTNYRGLIPKTEIEEPDRDTRYDRLLEVGEDLNRVEIAGYACSLHCPGHAYDTCFA